MQATSSCGGRQRSAETAFDPPNAGGRRDLGGEPTYGIGLLCCCARMLTRMTEDDHCCCHDSYSLLPFVYLPSLHMSSFKGKAKVGTVPSMEKVYHALIAGTVTPDEKGVSGNLIRILSSLQQCEILQ